MWSLHRSLRSIRAGCSSTKFTVPQNVKFSAFTARKLNPILSQKQTRIISDEYTAVLRMLKRSSPELLSNDYICRNFHTSARLFEDNSSREPKKDESGSDKNPSKNESSSPKKKKKKKKSKKNDEKEKDVNIGAGINLLAKAVLWASLLYSTIALLTLITKRSDFPEAHDNREISWNEFVYHMLLAGEVDEIRVIPDMDVVTIRLHPGAIVKGRAVRNPIFYMNISDSYKFEEKVRLIERQLGIKDGVTIKFDRQTSEIARTVVQLAFIILIIWLLSRAKIQIGDVSSMLKKTKITIINPFEKGKGVYFKDVAGSREAKQEVIEFVDYLKNPQKYQKLGAKVPKGALLLGPPGCGKTLLAKAVATEAKVPFLTMNGSEFIEMIGGLGAARVRDLFKEARKRAPCIVYIDEIDAIGKKRAANSHFAGGGESEQTLNQLLVEMDGIASQESVLMLASTNRADVLDKALLRPGRFDRHILIDLPNLIERQEIFEKHLSRITLDHEPSYYSQRLAVLTPGYSGADIANVCNEAALHAARTQQKQVTRTDLEYAVERVVGGIEKKSHAMTKEERRIVAYHESGHALIGWLLENSDVLQKVTIVPRTSLALGFAQYTPSEQKLFSKDQLLDKMCMILGGRAAENITFSRITTGAQNDLDKVTKMAYAMVSKYGMNEEIGPMCVPEENENNFFGTKPYSNNLGGIVDMESRKMVQAAYVRAEQVLKTNREKLITLAEALLNKETLNYDEVVALIGPPTHEATKRKIDPIEFENSMNNNNELPADTSLPNGNGV